MRLRRIFAATCAVLLVALALSASASAAPPPPSVARASGAIVIDASDGTVLLKKNPDTPREIASTTKLMTALLVLERAKLSDVFTAPQYNALPAESRINLRKGERMQVRDLLRALLLESANDAAATLAQGVGGSRARFVQLMNERAAELGLRHTRYANPIGLDAPDNHSSAADLAKLAARLLANRTFAGIVDRRSAQLATGARPRVVENRNLLVGNYPFVDGVKTGHTIQAGYVLVGAAHRGDAKVVSVVLGEPSEAARDVDTLALLRYGLSRFRRVEPLRADQVVADLPIEHRDERAELVPRAGFALTIRRGERVGRRLALPDRLKGPIAAGTRVGSVTVLREGKPVRRIGLLTANEVPGAGFLRVLTSDLGTFLTVVLSLLILGGSAILVLEMRRRRRRANRRRARSSR